MLSQLPTGAIIRTGAIATRRDAICMSGAFALDLGVIGVGSADSSFTASVPQNRNVPSNSLLIAAKLACRGG